MRSGFLAGELAWWLRARTDAGFPEKVNRAAFYQQPIIGIPGVRGYPQTLDSAYCRSRVTDDVEFLALNVSLYFITQYSNVLVLCSRSASIKWINEIDYCQAADRAHLPVFA